MRPFLLPVLLTQRDGAGVQQQALPTAKWASRVNWVVGDPLDVAMVEQVVHESTAVISTIGSSMESPLSEPMLKDLLSELQSPSTDKLQELYSQLKVLFNLLVNDLDAEC